MWSNTVDILNKIMKPRRYHKNGSKMVVEFVSGVYVPNTNCTCLISNDNVFSSKLHLFICFLLQLNECNKLVLYCFEFIQYVVMTAIVIVASIALPYRATLRRGRQLLSHDMAGCSPTGAQAAHDICCRNGVG